MTEETALFECVVWMWDLFKKTTPMLESDVKYFELYSKSLNSFKSL